MRPVRLVSLYLQFPLLLALAAAGCSEARPAPGGTEGEEEQPDCVDEDGDGYGAAGHLECEGHEGEVDCDDSRGDVHPGATDVPGNNIDEDCNGQDAVKTYPNCHDLDGDGYGREGKSECPKSNLPDCNDGDSKVNPGALEIPDNGKDDDCQGGDAHQEANCVDEDEDGYGARGHTECLGHPGEVDCNDADPAVHPAASEIPDNEVDENCDGYVAQSPATCEDNDQDGFGKPPLIQCGANNTPDCDDDDPDVYPGADEKCNGKDDNCDSTIDECPGQQVCHETRNVCIATLGGSCQNHFDCNEGLRCSEDRDVCLAFVGEHCERNSDCFLGFCDTANNVCAGSPCEVLDCEGQGMRCRDDIGCYQCEDSDIGNGCDEGVCAGYYCYVDNALFYDVYDSPDVIPEHQLALWLVDCHRRMQEEGAEQPYLCGGIYAHDLSDDVTQEELSGWVCDESIDSDFFMGGFEDRELAVDIVGCGLFNLVDLRFIGPLRAGGYYQDCFWIDGDTVVGPCEQFPAP